jgi:hypothetical protein
MKMSRKSLFLFTKDEKSLQNYGAVLGKQKFEISKAVKKKSRVFS